MCTVNVAISIDDTACPKVINQNAGVRTAWRAVKFSPCAVAVFPVGEDCRACPYPGARGAVGAVASPPDLGRDIILVRGIGQAFSCRDVATRDILATLENFVPS